MLVMPNNHSSSIFHYWAGKYGFLGNLYSPFYMDLKKGITYKSFTPHSYLPYALDNGKFINYTHGIEWDKSLFIKHCERIKNFAHKPLWIVVPDEVGKAEITFQLFHEWHDYLRQFNVPLALAVQDGMSVEQVISLSEASIFDREKDVIFVGGSTQWKLQTLNGWCKHFKRVHCARVNTWKRLWIAKEAGCESCDGSGWFRKTKQDLESLELFLAIQAGVKDLPKQFTLSLGV